MPDEPPTAWSVPVRVPVGPGGPKGDEQLATVIPAAMTASKISETRRTACPRCPSGRAAADQPDGGGDEQHRQHEQPAALDPLERPEPAAGLVAAPRRVAVLGEALRGRAIAPRAEFWRALAIPEPRAGNAYLPPLVYHWFTIHAEPGRLGLLVTSGVM